MLESRVEAGLRKQVVKHGGLFLKFVSPSQAGVPDRIIITGGRVIFVELKKQGAKPRKLQDKVIERMRSHGADVRVVAGEAEADALVEELWPEKKEVLVNMNPLTTPSPAWIKSYRIRAGARGAGKRHALEMHTFPPEDGHGNFIYPEEDDDGV